MVRTITWLHLSDLHARLRDDWDAQAISDSLVRDLKAMQNEHGLRPDLVFFTGDAAYGAVDAERMEDQYQRVRAFFDAVRKAFHPEVSLQDLYVVPGNHDVDRGEITPDQTAWLRHRDRKLIEITTAIRDARRQWQAWMDRLSAYRHFLTSYGLLHLAPDDPRLIWTHEREIAGARVGIAGLNSAWSCADDQDKGRLWCGADWQISELVRRMGPVDLSFALIHHPGNWFTDREDPALMRRLRQEFPLVLHGHEHADWVEVDAGGRLVLSAGAAYECSWMANGYSIGQLSLELATGFVRLREWNTSGRGWVARNIAGRTQDGVWPLTNLSWLSRPDGAAAHRRPLVDSTVDDPSSVPATSVVEHYTRRFCRHVIEQHNVLELFGCDIPRELQRYQLSVAYISLKLSTDAAPDLEISGTGTATSQGPVGSERARVPFDGDVTPEMFDDSRSHGLFDRKALRKDAPSLAKSAFIEEMLDNLSGAAKRLIIQGPAGAGKSTLLRWCAIEAARSMIDELEGDALDARGIGHASPANECRGPSTERSWRQKVPILVRLRECQGGTLPAANDLPRFLAKHLPSAPADWMTRILDDGRALVLLDGVDEVHRDKRAQLAEEIGELIRTYPDCTYVVSTRAGAVEDGWLDHWHFTEAQVEPMSRSDRDEFIDRWYRSAALELKQRPRPGEDLPGTALRLRRELSDQPELAALATNPLLCAMICALYRERQERLPETPSELCEALCHMLVHRRERETLGLGDTHFNATWRELNYAQKKSLLADLAWEMARAGESSIELSAAISLIAKGLASTPGRTEKEASDVLQALVERSGLLRPSDDDHVDFLHNTLKEYLAAAFVVDSGDWTSLAEHADDPAWQPIVLFALSLGGEPFSSALVGELLTRVELLVARVDAAPTSRSSSKAMRLALQQAKAREFFLVRCRTAAKRLNATHSTAIDEISQRFLPPMSMREAEALASIGERILLHSADNLSDPTWWASQTASMAIRCLRLLRRIGGRSARSILSSIDRLPSSSALLNEEWLLACNDLTPEAPLRWPFEEQSQVVLSGTKVRDLQALAASTSLKELHLDRTHVTNLSSLAALTTLEYLDLRDNLVSDLNPLGSLTSLKSLFLSDTAVTDLTPLVKLSALQEISLAGTPVQDWTPLGELKELTYIDLSRTRIVDLIPLARLLSIEFLHLGYTSISDISSIAGLTALRYLHLGGTQVTTLEPLARLSARKPPGLGSAHVVKIAPLAELSQIEWLHLDGTPVKDINALCVMTSLRYLNLDRTHVGNLAPIAGLSRLVRLHLRGSAVEDLTPLSGLHALQTLDLARTSVSDLRPLAGLSALQKVVLTETEVTDVTPLARTSVQRLGISGARKWELSQLADCKSLRSIVVEDGMISNDEIALFQKRRPNVIVTSGECG